MNTDNLEEQDQSTTHDLSCGHVFAGFETKTALPDPLLELGLAHHEAGRLDEAQAMYRCVLEQRPDHDEALHLLGVTEHQMGKHAAAIKLIRHAIELNSQVPLYHNNLGSAYQALRLFDEAGRSVASSIALKPDSANAHYNLGVIFDGRGEQEKAEASFRHAVSLQPDLAQAHFNLGILLRRNSRFLDAAHCFQRVVQLDVKNVNAQFLLAAMNGQQVERAPDRYIESVFDADAEKFDQHLLKDLHYDTPQRLLDLCIGLLRGARKKDMLDLGCGTGLVGASFSPYARQLVGVDLSTKMLEKAQARQLYQRLEHAEMLTMMRSEQGASYDIVVAADVLIYSGKLEDVFAQSKRLLRNGGLFLFSVEALDALLPIESMRPEGTDFQLNVNGRFAHSAAYIHDLAFSSGFTINTMMCVPARLEAGSPVMAWLVLLESSDDS